MTVELVVLVGIVLLAFIDTLAIAAWREVRVAQATRPTGMRALFVFGSGSAEDHVHVGARPKGHTGACGKHYRDAA